MQFLKTLLKIAGWGTISIAVLLLIIGVVTCNHTRNFVKSARRAQGTVIKLDEKDGSASFPVVRFHDAKGQWHEIESSSGQNPPAYKVGDIVTVLYQSDSPKNAKINTFSDTWGLPVMLAVFGILNGVFGVVMLTVGMKLQVQRSEPSVRAHLHQSITHSVTLEISYSKALFFATLPMACFVIGLFAIGIPMKDPLFIGFLVCVVTVMTFTFAGCLCFMLRCKIDQDGLRSAVPTFYQTLLRWEEVKVVSTYGAPFYVFSSGGLGGYCILPRRFLLKRPEILKQFVEQYAPKDNIIRKMYAF
jgi:hypothetical protein